MKVLFHFETIYHLEKKEKKNYLQKLNESYKLSMLFGT